MAGDFDLSARITADASGLVQAGAQAEAAYQGVGRAGKEAAAGARELEAATEGAGKAANDQTRSERDLTKAQEAAARAARGAATETLKETIARERASKAALDTSAAEARLSAAQSAAERSAAAAALAALKLSQAQERVGKTARDSGATVEAVSNRQAFAVRNLGQQFGDFATQVSLGGGFARAFASQAGQAGFALSEFGGRLGKVGAFLVGPWGIALTTAAIVLAPFVESLFEGSKAADDLLDKTSKAVNAADSYGAAQGYLGKAIDLTTGKLKTQNETLIETIKLQARAGILKAQQDQRDAREALKSVGDPGFIRGAINAGGKVQGLGIASVAAGIVGGATGNAASGTNPALAGIARQFSLGKLTQAQAQARIDRLGLGEERAVEEGLKLAALATAREDEKANREALTAARGGGLSAGLKQYQRPKKVRTKKPASTAARDEFGRDAADRLANLRDSFDDTPEAIRRVNTQIRQLDDLIDDLARKKPPGFGKLIADARALKPLILDSLNKPFSDYIEDQERALAVQRLATAGRVDEAAALRTVQQLERTMGPLTLEQRDAILAANQALREQQREADILREKQQAYLTALGSIKAAVRGAIFDGVDGIEALPGRLIKAFSTLKAEQLFDNLFGGVFRDLEDQVNGTSTAKDAAERFAKAVDKVSDKTTSTASAVASLKPPVDDAARALGGFTAALNGAASAAGSSGSTASGMATLQSLLSQYKGPDGPTGSDVSTDGQEVVVTASRRQAMTPEGFFGKALGDIGGKIVGAFTNPETGKRIGASLGQYAGKAIGGAAEGAAINSALKPIANALGLKTSKTGAQIGGAIGSFVPIPGGREIGAVAGSIIGGLFKTTKTGSATIGSLDGIAGITGTGGNNAKLKSASSGLAGAVSDTVNNIVAQLGGTLGSFAVSIGQKNGKFIVDTSGRGSTKTGKSNDGITGYKTAEEAQAAALADALADGAVQGLSAAVQRAFSSTTDVDKALREALNVKALETALGGVGGSIKAAFDAEATSAKERLRLARAYGLDIVAVEKLNAEQRAKLVDDTLKSRIGSLSDFLDQLKFGDLAEGTAVDKRNALIDKIASVQADADAGKDGAADQLANLYAQLVQNSRDAFGTAGGDFTTDRSSAQTGAERVIAMERARVNEAAGITAATQATTAAIVAGNALVDEGNDLAAQQLTATREVAASLTALLSATNASPVDYSVTARTSVLA